MRNFLVTMTRDAIDAEAARAYVQANTRPDHDPQLVETVGGVGVYPFIERIEHLFGPSPQPEYNEYRSADANGRVAWTLVDGQGQGDTSTEAANVEWFDQEFPDLLDILGVTVACSAGDYGIQPATLPRRRGADPSPGGSQPGGPTQPSPQPENGPARSTSSRIGIDPQQFEDPALVDLGDIEGPLTLVGLAAHLDGHDYYARVRRATSPWAVAVRRATDRRDGGSEPWVRGIALAQPGHEIAVATLLRGGFAEEHDLALLARGFGDRGGVWSLLPDDTLGDSDYCRTILVSNDFPDGIRLEQDSLHFWPGYDGNWPYAVYEVRAGGDVVGVIVDCPEPETAAETEQETARTATTPQTLASGLTRAQDAALRDAIRVGFESLPGYHAGPAMKPLMEALGPVVARLVQEGQPSFGGTLTDAFHDQTQREADAVLGEAASDAIAALGLGGSTFVGVGSRGTSGHAATGSEPLSLIQALASLNAEAPGLGDFMATLHEMAKDGTLLAAEEDSMPYQRPRYERPEELVGGEGTTEPFAILLSNQYEKDVDLYVSTDAAALHHIQNAPGVPDEVLMEVAMAFTGESDEGHRYAGEVVRVWTPGGFSSDMRKAGEEIKARNIPEDRVFEGACY